MYGRFPHCQGWCPLFYGRAEANVFLDNCVIHVVSLPAMSPYLTNSDTNDTRLRRYLTGGSETTSALRALGWWWRIVWVKGETPAAL